MQPTIIHLVSTHPASTQPVAQLTQPPIAQPLLLDVALKRPHFLQLGFLALSQLSQPLKLLLLSGLVLLTLILLFQKF